MAASRKVTRAKKGPAVKRENKAMDASKALAKKAALAKAQKTRAKASLKTKVDKNSGNMSMLAQNLEMGEIMSWVESKPQLQSWLASIMRNGILEADYNTMLTGKTTQVATSRAGTVVIPEKAATWGKMRVEGAKALLTKMLEDESVPSWFQGDDKLPSDMAKLAVQKIVGVRDKTPAPQGHPQGNHLMPLLWLAKEKKLVGGKVSEYWKNSTKESLQERIEWFHLKHCDDEWRFFVNLDIGPTELTVKGVAWDEAEDWKLELPEDYENCELVSESLPFRMPAWSMVPKSIETKFDSEVHFDVGDEVPGLPTNGAPSTLNASLGLVPRRLNFKASPSSCETSVSEDF